MQPNTFDVEQVYCTKEGGKKDVDITRLALRKRLQLGALGLSASL